MSDRDERERRERKAPAADEVHIRKSRRNVNWEARAEADIERRAKYHGIWERIEDAEQKRKRLRKVKCTCGHRGDKHVDGPCFACGWREKDRCVKLTPIV